MSAVVEGHPETGGSLLLSQPIVIDNGTATIKAGFAGSSKPKVRLFYTVLYSCAPISFVALAVCCVRAWFAWIAWNIRVLHCCVVLCMCVYVCLLQVVLGTKVGRAKHMRIMPGGALETEEYAAAASATSIFVGRKLDEHRGAFYLEYPMDKGAVTETGWDAMERLWEVSVCDVICVCVVSNYSNSRCGRFCWMVLLTFCV